MLGEKGGGFMNRDEKGIPSMVKNRQLVERRRQQIVQAACDLFVRKGFHKTTTREIARECGLSIGTMYEYIQTKEDVLYLVCDFIHSELESRLRKALEDTGTGRECLVRAVAQHFKVMEEMSDNVLLIYQETKSLPKKAMESILRREEEITSLFAEILYKGIDDGTLQLDTSSVRLMAHNIIVLGQMWTFRRWALSGHYTLKEFTEKQTSLLLHELTHEGKGGK